jgi:hypothetical protein
MTDEQSALSVLATVLETLPRCQKGCCLAPATRIAPYKDGDGNVVVEMESCDLDGGPTIREFDNAEAVRAAAQLLEGADLQWWDLGSLNAPRRITPA